MFQSQTGSPSSSDEQRVSFRVMDVTRFNPKREAHPLQTARRCRRQGLCWCFNPKREAHPLQTVQLAIASNQGGVFQSQTGSPSSSDRHKGLPPLSDRQVSIPNGKPILFRPFKFQCDNASLDRVSIPNGKPILFRPIKLIAPCERKECFNPKREAHPLQTLRGVHLDSS